ncbi:MAG: hypothetical protein KDC71_00365, partial [Acidobacteria bacterium]|nr:hypothetical protein [Acidobacteriota bacterium]
TTFFFFFGCEEAARLVYAGHIASEQTDPRLYGDNQLLPIFQSLIHQGFKLDAYLTSPQNLFDLHYPNYLRLQANANFHLLPTLPVQTLLQNINRAFAGLQWGSPPANSLQTVSHPVTVSKKILTYAAAGIPVVLFSYLSGMAEWVREYQMGWSVGELQETDLQQLFSRQTRESRIPGLMAFREMSCLESQIKGLIPFLRKYIQA